jgi:hypothetical protein
LDKGLRVLLKDLALTRSERVKRGKDDLLVSVDRLLEGLAEKPKVERRIMRFRRSLLSLVFTDWATERSRLEFISVGDRSVGKAGKKRASKKRS